MYVHTHIQVQTHICWTHTSPTSDAKQEDTFAKRTGHALHVARTRRTSFQLSIHHLSLHLSIYLSVYEHIYTHTHTHIDIYLHRRDSRGTHGHFLYSLTGR